MHILKKKLINKVFFVVVVGPTVCFLGEEKYMHLHYPMIQLLHVLIPTASVP